MNQNILNNYFSSHWHSNLDQYLYTGWTLINKINTGERVLDVGCGPNLYKDKIKNLIGIDPAFTEADHQCTIEEFKTDKKFDIAFCLGSINFGMEENIINQIRCLVNLLNPVSRIYWRCNPGVADHTNEECKEIDFYPWSIDKHIKLSELFGFRLMTCCWDSNNRIYAEWSRSA